MTWNGADRRKKKSQVESQFDFLRDELLHKVDEVAEKSINRTLTACGFDTKNPLKTQQDMAYLHNIRIASQDSFRRVRTAGIMALFGGGGAALWEGIKAFLGGNHG